MVSLDNHYANLVKSQASYLNCAQISTRSCLASLLCQKCTNRLTLASSRCFNRVGPASQETSNSIIWLKLHQQLQRAAIIVLEETKSIASVEPKTKSIISSSHQLIILIIIIITILASKASEEEYEDDDELLCHKMKLQNCNYQ